MGTGKFSGRLQRKLEELGAAGPGGTTGAAEAGLAHAADPTVPPVLDLDRSAPAVLPQRPHGPHDASDVVEAVGYLDLGPLLLPVRDDVEMRVSLDDDVPSDLLIFHAGWNLRLDVFAAPRTEGTWVGVCEEIAAALAADDLEVRLSEGPFGPQLHTTMVGPSGEPTTVRVIGIDGPGWLLRATVQSPTADVDESEASTTEPASNAVEPGAEVPGAAGSAPAAPALEDVAGLPGGPLGEILLAAIVRRGHAPLPPGAPLPLVIDPVLLGQPRAVENPGVAAETRFQHLPGLWT